MHFKNAVFKIGLSWPSLSKALGRKVDDPSRWAVLYLGSAKVADLDTEPRSSRSTARARSSRTSAPSSRDIEGIVLLDGTWSQAKALWWRNAWMLKCQRVILGPKRPSRYGKLRKEPRGDGLSTIEAAAPAAGRPRKAAGYRGNAQRKLRPHAGDAIGKCRRKCRNSRPSRRNGITGGASGADFGLSIQTGRRRGSLARSNDQCCSVTRQKSAADKPVPMSEPGQSELWMLWIMMTSLLTVLSS